MRAYKPICVRSFESQNTTTTVLQIVVVDKRVRTGIYGQYCFGKSSRVTISGSLTNHICFTDISGSYSRKNYFVHMALTEISRYVDPFFNFRWDFWVSASHLSDFCKNSNMENFEQQQIDDAFFLFVCRRRRFAFL